MSALLTILLVGCGGDLHSSTANTAPQLRLVVPQDDAPVSVFEPVVLLAVVGDDSTAVDELEVAWTWGEDGAVITGQARVEGDFLSLDLDEVPAVGAYTVRVTVTDTQGQASWDEATLELVEPELPDLDEDGHGDAAAGGTDCNDLDADFHPGAQELCNGLDDDCDGEIDEGAMSTWYPDNDGDGFAGADGAVSACHQPAGTFTDAADCDDSDPSVHPDAVEICDGVDQDCDGVVDDGSAWFTDLDGDGAGDPLAPLSSCDGSSGAVLDDTDCFDSDASSRWCRSCADVAAVGMAAGDGIYPLGDDSTGAFDAWCDFDDHGGDWTLLATNTWSGAWDVRQLVDDEPFGTPSIEGDHKGQAFSVTPFTDVLFVDDLSYALYSGVGDGRLSWLDFQRSLPLPNCGEEDSGQSWAMTEGTLSGATLCDTKLYVNVASYRQETGVCHLDDGSVFTIGWGPTWNSISTGATCPLQGPHTVTFVNDLLGTNPWAASGSPLRMYVR